MSQFGLVKSFQIDNGELDGLRANYWFLGYELPRSISCSRQQRRYANPSTQTIEVESSRHVKTLALLFKLTWLPGDDRNRGCYLK